MQSSFIHTISERKWAQWLLILLITLIWGYSWVLMKDALRYMGPYTFSALRFGTGAATMLTIVWLLRVGRPPKSAISHLIVVGILQTSVVFLLVMYALKFIDAGKSSLLLYSMPLWSGLLAAFFLREKISALRWGGVGLGVAGLLVVMGADALSRQSAEVLWGEFLIVLAAVSWGASNIYYRLKLGELSKLQVNAYQMLFGTIGITLVAWFAEGGETVVWTAESVYYVLFTGVLASALCFTVWFMLLSVVDMIGATMPSLLVPVFGLFFGWLLLGEVLTASVLIGSTLILSGVWLSSVRR
ncbi:EamA family transporter [Halalkalibacillus sediminis]|uniref:EamA family transporter n=1 Tax=Halalkalibacillus sediminis TaxID=2018042 RepID=A0A2I0QUB2_9BACI|nr:DMT family transporter [Halalkalibacillus sediminis]PKR77899.1 EamA family transporter [Halalkalibacillus sediminis]